MAGVPSSPATVMWPLLASVLDTAPDESLLGSRRPSAGQAVCKFYQAPYSPMLVHYVTVSTLIIFDPLIYSIKTRTLMPGSHNSISLYTFLFLFPTVTPRPCPYCRELWLKGFGHPYTDTIS